MKNAFGFFFSIMLLQLFAAPPSAVSQTIVNGGFESGGTLPINTLKNPLQPMSVGSWTGVNWGGCGTPPVIVTSPVKTGNYSVQIDTRICFNGEYIYQDIENTSASFTWSFSVYRDSGINLAQLLANWHTESGSYDRVSAVHFDDTGTNLYVWGGATIRLPFILSTGSWHQVVIQANGVEGTQIFNIDGTEIGRLSSNGQIIAPSAIIFGDVAGTANHGNFVYDDVIIENIVSCQEDDTGAIDIPTSEGTLGGTVSIPVRVQNTPGTIEAMGFDFVVPTGLTYTGYTKGSLIPSNYMVDVNQISANTLRCGAFKTGGTTVIGAGSSGVLLYLNFTVANTFVETQASLTGLKDDIGTWSSSPGCVKTGCSGDTNKDGQITPGDALNAFQKYMLICPTSNGLECGAFCADVNKDGKDTPADALCIFKKYLGQASCLD
jgi:hypothetical protein